MYLSPVRELVISIISNEKLSEFGSDNSQKLLGLLLNLIEINLPLDTYCFISKDFVTIVPGSKSCSLLFI